MTQAIHRVSRMGGRDPMEEHRSATPLELLYDLAFVIAFGVAADELAHFLVEDHLAEGLVGFVIAVFAISWAWIQNTWFASAYDTDDWVYRVFTMVQMLGVLILALGLPATFESLLAGETINNRVMVLGYVVMRVPLIAQWMRAAKQDPGRRSVHMTYISTLLVAQAGWIGLALAQPPIALSAIIWLSLFLIELAGPVIAEVRKGGTPWHAHHIAERYGLMVIIALGEGMIGTMAAMSAVVAPGGPGYSIDFAVVLLAGVALTFGIWWVYFVLPNATLLSGHRERSFGWGYGHIPLFGAVVAVGAGLHAAAFYLEGHTDLTVIGTVLAVAVPMAILLVVTYLLYAALARTFDGFHLFLLAISVGVLIASVAMAASGVALSWSLLVLALTPWVTVIGYELVGYRHGQAVLDALNRT